MIFTIEITIESCFGLDDDRATPADALAVATFA
jgi:hypothetical protein